MISLWEEHLFHLRKKLVKFSDITLAGLSDRFYDSIDNQYNDQLYVSLPSDLMFYKHISPKFSVITLHHMKFNKTIDKEFAKFYQVFVSNFDGLDQIRKDKLHWIQSFLVLDNNEVD